MANKTLQGWYKIVNESKFVFPQNNYMDSYKKINEESFIFYRSSYELQGFRFADSNPGVVKFSVEPFAINYIKPSTGKSHRYFIDMYLEFKSGDKFIVEIKPKTETQPPKPPRKQTQKSLANYQRALITYSTNQAKWKAAEEFAKKNNMRFIILTDVELFGK